MAGSIPQFAGLSFSNIGDLGVKILATPEDTGTPTPPGEPIDEEIFEHPPLHASK
jgi:hypothetical protein